MGFEICNFSDLKEGNAIFEKMRKSIDLKRLVPVLGSGFSFNFHTNGGRVPSVDDLKSEMVRLLKECEEYECTSEEELRAAELSELADALLPILEKCADSMEVDKEKTTVLSHFLKYMEDNFYQVRSVPNHIKEFLKCEWPYLYTLNYDDAIEKTIGVENCEIVIPYSDLNRTWLDTRTCVIKLHGDVHRLLQTKDLHFCILNKKQYLESITSKENKALMEWLKTDYTSKDLLFIGCGLNNEIDFLFAEGVAKASKLSDTASENSFYIYIVELYIAWYNSMETRKPYEVYEAIKPYYYLDTLQTMFFFDSPSKGSIVLPHIIYSKLRTVLNGEYQFLHQTAKCELRYSQQLGLKTPVGRKLLEEANIIIDRALELAEKSQNANRQYTLTHMNVTKALILTNYLRYVKDSTDRSVMHLRTAINSYYYFYVEYNEYSADLTGSELTDTRWFMEQFAIEPHEFRKLIVEKEYQQKVQDVLSAYYKKPITVMWK